MPNKRLPKSGLRILIRKRATEFYLQPSGAWNLSRQRARQFATSIIAYVWAKEQNLVGIEVVLAFKNPVYDFALLRR